MKTISREDLKKLMESNKPIRLLDIREDWERDEFNIGGDHISMYDIPKKLEYFNDLGDEDVILYCRSGNRSSMMQKWLKYEGIQNTINLIGGIKNWENE